VTNPVLLAEEDYRRVFDQGRKLIAGDVGIYTEA
jgi:hypothetical protein